MTRICGREAGYAGADGAWRHGRLSRLPLTAFSHACPQEMRHG